MRKLQTILVTLVMVASLHAAAGTAWARSESSTRGTAWTDVDVQMPDEPIGVSWELFGFAF